MEAPKSKHFNRYCFCTERKYQIKVLDAETGQELGRTDWCPTLDEAEARAKKLQHQAGDTV